MNAIRAVLFDFDGTLADSYDAIAASINHVRAAHGLSPLSVDQVRVHVGHGPGHLMKHTVGVGDRMTNEALYHAHHPTVIKQGTRLLDGAGEVLRTLHGAGQKLALCSNKPVRYSRELLAHLNVADCFDAILGPEDVVRPKPAPDLLLAGLRRLGVRAPEALYVGDMTVDVSAGRAAGLRVWVVPTGSDDRAALVAARPDRLLDRLKNVLDVL